MTIVQKNDRRTVFGWAMYDWANSSYITTVGAIVGVFFTGVIVPDEGFAGMNGVELWSLVVVFGAVILFVWMPVLGAMADYASAKRRFLSGFMVVGAVTMILLPLVPDGAVITFLAVVLITQIGFVAGNVFYDSYLPLIATDETIDQVSSKGFAFGYLGGGLYVLLAFVLLNFSGEESLTGLSDSTAARIGIAGAGVWWLGFGFFSLRRLPKDGEPKPLPPHMASRPRWRAYASIGFSRTWATARRLLGFKHILLFIVAFFFYNDAVSTVIQISGPYAEETLQLGIEEVVITFLIVQFVAFFGALGFGRVAVWIGAKPTIMVTLVIWIGIVIAAFYLPVGHPVPLYGLGVVVGLVLGGVQALSRSLYGSMIPEEASAEFFGFFTVLNKFSAIWGPSVFFLVSRLTGSSRPAILSLGVLLVIGLILLSRVDVEKARDSRTRWDFVEP